LSAKVSAPIKDRPRAHVFLFAAVVDVVIASSTLRISRNAAEIICGADGALS
jgi:hypothetical protein